MAYESPVKQKLRDAVARLGGRFPDLERQVLDAVEKIDDTDPSTVARKLPPDLMQFIQTCTERGQTLALHGKSAREQGFFIEIIIVCHGLIQYALRGLYVLAWQRSREAPLGRAELKPFVDQNDHRASVNRLIPVLVESGLLYDTQGELLKTANQIRNKVAHGVVSGEVSLEDLRPLCEKVEWAATGALQQMFAWFNNPRPLVRVLDFGSKPGA